jgi:predicted transcriptional regulator
MNSSEPGTKHQGYPLVDSRGVLLGVLTRRDILDPSHSPHDQLMQLVRRPPVLVYDDSTLRDAADHMCNHNIGRLPVVERGRLGKVVGMVTRSDLLFAHRRRLEEQQHQRRHVRLWPRRRRRIEPTPANDGNQIEEPVGVTGREE